MRRIGVIFIATVLSACTSSFDSARIMWSTPPVVCISLGADDGVREGDEFSIWRTEQRKKGDVIYGTAVYRVGEVRVFRVESGGTSLAEVVRGNLALGDRVTKWLISEGGKPSVLQK